MSSHYIHVTITTAKTQTRLRHRGCSCFHSLLPPTPPKPLVCSSFYNSVVSRMLRKWNCIACNLLRLASFIPYNSLTSFRGVAFITSSFLFLPEWYFTVRRDHRWFNRSPIEGHLSFSHTRTVFCVNRNLHYRGINAQECNCWVIWQARLVFFFFSPHLILKNQTKFRQTLPE